MVRHKLEKKLALDGGLGCKPISGQEIATQSNTFLLFYFMCFIKLILAERKWMVLLNMGSKSNLTSKLKKSRFNIVI